MEKIALFGATGNVGRRIAEQLLEKGIASSITLDLYASPSSKGKLFMTSRGPFIIHSPEDCNFKDYGLCLFATDSDISRCYVPKALAAGCIVVDSSSAYRMDPDTPLIVVPVNGDKIDLSHHRLYSCPNCIASPLSLVLAPLQRQYGIKRVSVTTYQSTSGAGKDPMDELMVETNQLLQGKTHERRHFLRQIAFNVIPQVDKIREDGFTSEEHKIICEVQKILGSSFPVTATSVRVPVLIGHSISAEIECIHPFDLHQATALLAASPCVEISKNPTLPHGLQLWLCSDNLRRGAATDAVEAAATLIQQGALHAAAR